VRSGPAGTVGRSPHCAGRAEILERIALTCNGIRKAVRSVSTSMDHSGFVIVIHSEDLSVVANLSGLHLLLLIVFLALDVLAIVQVWRDRHRGLVAKIVLTVVIVVFPVIGFIAWLIVWLISLAASRPKRGAV
jgi:Kef-type K+ transport system membrane component KefB